MPSQLIKFSLIDPNPHRDFVINPMAEAHLVEMVASIEAHDFWAGCLVRPYGRRFQLAFGHVRLEAAKRAGLTAAEFQVVPLDDDQMLQRMFAENATQFGKPTFPTYKEAVFAAAGRIMAVVIADPSRAQNVLTALCRDGVKREDIARIINEIQTGGAPGEDIVLAYLKIASRGDVRTALQLYRDGGDLAAWHAEHNPKAKAATKPTINPEAVGQFSRTAHVKAFVDAVKINQIPVAKQPAVARRVLSELVDNRPPAKPGSARPEAFDSSVPKEERLTIGNIRAHVHTAAIEGTKSARDRAVLATRERQTTLERGLDDAAQGLDRTLRGFRQVATLAEAIGDLRGEMSALALLTLDKISRDLRSLDRLLAHLLPGRGTQTDGQVIGVKQLQGMDDVTREG